MENMENYELFVESKEIMLPNGEVGTCGYFSDNKNEMYMLFTDVIYNKGDMYTFCIDIKPEQSGSILSVISGGIPSQGVFNLTANVWNHVAFTLESDGNDLNIELIPGAYYVWHGQLISGEEEKDWTPNLSETPQIAQQTRTEYLQTAEMFSWLVSDNFSETNVELSADAYRVASENIILSGSNIQLDGNTTIGSGFVLTADNIDVNSIFAQEITATQFTGVNANFTGETTFESGNRKNIIGSDGIELYVNDNFTGKFLSQRWDNNNSMLMLAISSGFGFAIQNESSTPTSYYYCNLGYDHHGYGRRHYFSGTVQFNSNIYIANNTEIRAFTGVNDETHRLLEFTDATNHSDLCCLGNQNCPTSIYTSNHIWYNGSDKTYLATSSDSSDMRLKEEVSNLDKYEEFFKKLNPIAFRYHDGLYNAKSQLPKIKWGLYAQEVINAFTETGINWEDEDFVLIDDAELSEEERKYIPDNNILKINYSNMISLTIHMTQMLIKRVEELEKIIKGD